MVSPSRPQILSELKRTLREQGLTYAHVAKALRLSLPTIKRMFSKGQFTLERVDRICQLAGASLADVVQRASERGTACRQLTHAQELQIVADPKLLLVTWLVINRVPLAQIVRQYRLSEREVLGHFIKLDRLKVIELQPGNRARLLVSRHFVWRPGGPVQRYIHEKLLRDFLASHFTGTDEVFYFHGGQISAGTLAVLRRALQGAAQECAEIIDAEHQPQGDRDGAAFVLALRRWRYSGFRNFER
jgi:transcriptional regulator with XRE-family HTH domain